MTSTISTLTTPSMQRALHLGSNGNLRSCLVPYRACVQLSSMVCCRGRQRPCMSMQNGTVEVDSGYAGLPSGLQMATAGFTDTAMANMATHAPSMPSHQSNS